MQPGNKNFYIIDNTYARILSTSQKTTFNVIKTPDQFHIKNLNENIFPNQTLLRKTEQ